MPAAKYNIRIEQGADFGLNLTIKDKSGSPLNLTGATIRSHVRKSYTAAQPLAVLTGSLVDAPSGTARLTLSAAESTALGARGVLSCVYDVELELADGTVIRLLEGTAVIAPEATR